MRLEALSIAAVLTGLASGWSLRVAGPGPCRLPNVNVGRLVMQVVPISRAQMQSIVPRQVTRPQLLAYWGMNPKERLQRILEAVLISYGGTWLAWFMSFMAGSLVSAVLGTALIFNWLYSPWLNAKTRNARMYPRLSPSSSSRRGRSRAAAPTSAHYAVFLGRIGALKKVKRRAGKTIGAVAQEYLVMNIADDLGRELEVITQWQGGYSALREGMLAPCVLASADRSFEDVFCVSDVFVPAVGTMVGDYPYLQDAPFRRLLQDIRAAGAAGGEEEGQEGGEGGDEGEWGLGEGREWAEEGREEEGEEAGGRGRGGGKSGGGGSGERRGGPGLGMDAAGGAGERARVPEPARRR